MIKMNGYKTEYERSIRMQPVWPQPQIMARELIGNELADRANAVEMGLSADLIETADTIIRFHLQGLGGLASAW